MVIVQQPDAVSFAGNIKDFVIRTDTDLRFSLAAGTEVVVDELYTPVSGVVTVHLGEVAGRYLSLSLPDYHTPVYEQAEALKTFVATAGEKRVEFTVIRGGVDGGAGAAEFLRLNFLTWQPQEKRTLARQPEWLTYYAAGACTLKIKGYFAGGESSVHSLSLPAGKVCSINLNYDVVNAYFAQPIGYYDVWVEDGGGNRLTYCQRYVLMAEPERAEVYVFENSVGGIDSFVCTGERKEKVGTEGVLATLYDETSDYVPDLSAGYEQNTGYLRNAEEAQWLRDFFVSPQRYHAGGRGLEKIYIEEQENSFTEGELNSYTFEYYRCRTAVYNYVVRNRESLPELLEFPSPGGLFFLTPRLSEYPFCEYADDLMVPVQHPYSGEWMRIPGSVLKPEVPPVDVAGYTQKGIASFDELHFLLEEGYVKLRDDVFHSDNFDRYFYEKEGRLYCRLDLIGEKGVSSYGLGPEDDSGGGMDETALQVYLDAKGYATEAWVNGQGYLTSLPAHNHDSLYSPLGHTHAEYLERTVWDGYFYEKDGRLYCRLDLIGEKGVSGYGLGPESSSGGGMNEATLQAYLDTKGYATEAWVNGQGYLTSLPAHNHDGLYAKIDHSHAGYAGVNHTHASTEITDLQEVLSGKMDRSAWDSYFYEKDGRLYCRMDLVGEKGISSYGLGPEGSSGGGMDETALQSYLDTKGYATENWVNAQGYLTSVPDLYVRKSGDTMTGSLRIVNGQSIYIKNNPSDNATGVAWRNQADNDIISGIGTHTQGDVVTSLFMGWGNSPWIESTNFSVSADKIKYKGYNVWHAGNSNVAGVDWTAKDIKANGYLRSVFNGNTVQIGSVNTAYCHFINSAAIPFYFNNAVCVDGDVYGGTGRYDRRLAYVDEVHGLAGNGEYDFLEKSSGCVQVIRVDGDKDTYYPVTINMKDSANYIKNIITITKWLGQASGAWPGNHVSHPNNGASGIYRYEYRNMQWDGNGGYVKTLHAWYGYAPFVAHTEGLSRAVGSLCIWLRGGGADYSLVANNPCTWSVYYSEINLGSSQYPLVVSPRTTMGNKGVYNNIVTPIVANQIPGRTLWGQYFNGTANVSGSLTGVTDLTASGTVQAAVVRGGDLIIHAGNEFNSATGGIMAIGYRNTAYVSVGASCKTIIGAYRDPSYTLDVAGDIISDSWIRTRGQTGWFNETYGGGWFMSDANFIRSYNKPVYIGNYSLTGPSNFGVSLALYGPGHTSLEIEGGGCVFGIGAHSNKHIYWWYGPNSHIGSGGDKGYVMEYTGSTWQFIGNLIATGEITAYAASDLRLKTNIRPLDGLSYIDKLRPVEFDWTSEARKLSGDNRRHGRGLIAQEVINVLPDAVGNIYNSEYLGIQYEKLIPVLIASVKQLSEKVKRLRREIR